MVELGAHLVACLGAFLEDWPAHSSQVALVQPLLPHQLLQSLQGQAEVPQVQEALDAEGHLLGY